VTKPKIAIAHDYLTQRGGAERVVLAMLRAFPEAPIYTTLYDPDGTYPEFRDADIRTSWLNKIPRFRKDHRLALPFLPAASDSLTIDADLVIVSSSGWAHGFPTRGRRLVYCYSPPRWVYLTDTYLGRPAHTSPVGLATLGLRPYLRRWDQARARRAEESGKYLAISTVVQERIRDCYGFGSEIVAAPHSYDASLPQQPLAALADWADGFHLVVSRLLPYKNVAHVVEAFRTLPHDRLVIVGRGPEKARLEASRPENVRMLEGLSDAEMRWVYAHCTALVAPSFEDFGLTPLEAGVYGKPALTLRGGGFLDTIAPGISGSFFEAATPGAIADAVRREHGQTWDADAIRRHINRFNEATFAARLTRLAADLLATER
jgi:glycosyltransferase involved in cell wall biosynthesis